MDKGDIQQMTEWFAAAAARAQEAGFDAVEVHAAHTYIIAGFLSPYYNQREDEYGGSLENRARLMVEILIAIRQRVGPDFGLWLRLDGEELRTPGGIGIVDAQAAAKLAVAAGAQAVNISAYASITTGAAFTEAPLVHTPGGFVGYAQAIKAAVAVPVIVAGRLNAEAAEAALAAGHCDFVAMARPLLADPDLPNKLAAGRLQDVRPCIYCYTCVSEIFFNRRVKCAVNPLTGHEFEDAINPAATPKRVLVVGGGPAGMEAARVAALRGHRVTLVERSDRLGGTLFFAALAAPENAPLLDYLVAQVGSLPIEVRLNTEVTLALVASLKAETIIVATGALRAPQPFPGSAQSTCGMATSCAGCSPAIAPTRSPGTSSTSPNEPCSRPAA
ncbi:MAG: FAD-dependent oxidoreductase [Betaproteobacteria bacterium]|nr:FAD-dependent oxidoreductase [Betaproteobacteria bacterium]